MNNMRNRMNKLIVVGAVVLSAGAFTAAPVLADGNQGSYTSADGRYSPQVDDRLVVYVKDTGVEVWGLDPSLNGFFLTTFTAAEFAAGDTVTHQTPQGSVTLRMNTEPTREMAFADNTATTQVVVATPGEYTMSWQGGSYGANGSPVFSKTILADYNPS